MGFRVVEETVEEIGGVFNLRTKGVLRGLYHLKRNFREEGIDLF